jgi:hypothetical protein
VRHSIFECRFYNTNSTIRKGAVKKEKYWEDVGKLSPHDPPFSKMKIKKFGRFRECNNSKSWLLL